MYDFKFSTYYRVMILALFVCSLVCLGVVISQNSGRPATFLAIITVAILFFYIIHAFRVKLTIDGAVVSSRGFITTRTIDLQDVISVNNIKLKGRYMVFLITDQSFVIISTLLNGFPKIREILKGQLAAELVAEFDKVSDESAAKATRFVNIFLAGFLILFAIVIVYLQYFR